MAEGRGRFGPGSIPLRFRHSVRRGSGTRRVGDNSSFILHGPDGKDYPNESVFVEVAEPERVVFEHLSGHHFEMTITFSAQGSKTVVGWRQVFDTAAERQRIAQVVIEANEQNLDRLAAEVLNVAP